MQSGNRRYQPLFATPFSDLPQSILSRGDKKSWKQAKLAMSARSMEYSALGLKQASTSKWSCCNVSFDKAQG